MTKRPFSSNLSWLLVCPSPFKQTCNFIYDRKFIFLCLKKLLFYFSGIQSWYRAKLMSIIYQSLTCEKIKDKCPQIYRCIPTYEYWSLLFKSISRLTCTGLYIILNELILQSRWATIWNEFNLYILTINFDLSI